MEKVSISKDALTDLLKLKEEFNLIIESLELMGDEEFMSSFKNSKEQIKNRKFADFNAL